jgi:hypothetical protein
MKTWACLGVAALGLAVGCDARKSDPTVADKPAVVSDKPVAKPAPKRPVAKGDDPQPPADADLSAAEVAKDVLADPRNEAQYRGRTIVAEGPVRKVFRRPNTPPDAVVVEVVIPGVSSPRSPDGVAAYCQCRLEDADKALSLTVGQTVKIRGRCGPAALAPDGCAILSTGPDPALKVELTDVVAEFLKDPAAAKAKYEGKPLAVTAEVERKEGGAENRHLLLKHGSDKPATVKAQWPRGPAVDERQFEAVKPGDRVTIKCRLGGVVLLSMSFEDCRLVP